MMRHETDRMEATRNQHDIPWNSIEHDVFPELF